MAWQNLLVIIIGGIVLVGGVALVLYVVHVRREAARWKAKHATALDVIIRLRDKEEIRNMDDEELHNEILEMLNGYSPDVPAGDIEQGAGI